MVSRTRKVSETEWRTWKDTILDLTRQGNTLKEVMATMSDKHGFNASISQYEFQFRRWGCRKNLSSDEWAHAFAIVDKLKSQHSEARIVIGGKPVDSRRIQLARQRYFTKKAMDLTRTMRALQNASIEIKGPDGEWTPYSDFELSDGCPQNQAGSEFASPVASALANARDKSSLNIEQRSHGQVCDFVQFPTHVLTSAATLEFESLADGQDPSSNSLNLWQFRSPMESSQRPPQNEVPMVDYFGLDSLPMAWEDLIESPDQLFSYSSPKSGTCSGGHVDRLSFIDLIKDMGFQGINSISRPQKLDETHSSAAQVPISLLHSDIISSKSEYDVNGTDKWSMDVTHLQSRLRNLLSNMDLHGDFPGDQSLLIEDDRLEAKDRTALKSFLRLPFIDINSIICIYEGQQYTPIERAASLQDLGIVQLFLEAKADVRKTYNLEPDKGILGKLLSSIHRHGGISSNVVKIGKILLKAGAKVHLNLVTTALKAHGLAGLAFGLVCSVSDIDHSDLIRGRLLSQLALHLDDWQAEQATKKMIMACERTKCRKCPNSYEEDIDWALIQGAKRGHLGLVQFLLSYSKTPHIALSGAIRSGRCEVIDAILTLNPDLTALPHSIDDHMWKDRDQFFEYDSVTTSHAEAIEAENDRLIVMIEEKGALSLLSAGERFEPAINAASKSGDMEYVRKLLRTCPSPNPRHMTRALVSAIQKNHEGIFRTLLAAGADVNMPGGMASSAPDALFTAIRCKNSGMVSAILNADVNSSCIHKLYKNKDGLSSILEEAFKWGDRAVIQTLLLAFPTAELRTLELSALNPAGFDILLEYEVASPRALTHFLEIALKRGDVELIQKLVDRGADPTNSRILVECVEKYPTMLPLLYKHISYRKGNSAVRGFGTDALKAAIRCGRAGHAAMEFLLNMGHVDAKSLSRSLTSGGYLQIETPLGLAIAINRHGHHSDFEVISKLLDYGCDINSTVRYLEGSDPEVKQTALLDAIDTRNTELVSFLIDRGAQINHEATLGLKRTPLQKAVEVDSFEIVTLLLKKGANVNARPAERGGATAFQLAAIRGNHVIAARLIQHGANLLAPPAQVNGRWPLEGAAENGRIQMVFYLWEQDKALFDVEKCQKAMELAEGNGFIACRDAIAGLSQEIVATTSVLGQN